MKNVAPQGIFQDDIDFADLVKVLKFQEENEGSISSARLRVGLCW